MLLRRARGGLLARYLLSIATALTGAAVFFAAFFPGSRDVVRAGPTRDVQPAAEGTAAQASGATRPRVVVMLVDALRADFLWKPGSRFAYVNAKIAEGAALPFTTRAHSPTVTLPRIKAMITGAIPGFLDVKANLDSPVLQEDSVISKAVAAGRRVLMYGDETWLKLFPSSFARSEGTTAFFVLDTKVVDDNVTRHVMPELDNDDWDLMILHYLGLDHAGHLGGTDTRVMHAKQIEMDDIVKQMHTTVQTREREDPTRRQTVIVLCSDHGMNSAGNHGGASEPETDAVAVFLGPPLPAHFASDGGGALYLAAVRDAAFPLVWQVDMASTLAALLGLESPVGNIGRLLPGALDHSPLAEYLEALAANARQLDRLILEQNADDTRLKALHASVRSAGAKCNETLSRLPRHVRSMPVGVLRRTSEHRYSTGGTNSIDGASCVLEAEAAYRAYTRQVCDRLEAEHGDNYDMTGIMVALAILGAAVLNASFLCFTVFQETASNPESVLHPEVSLRHADGRWGRFWRVPPWLCGLGLEDVIVGSGCVLHILSLLSSSMIEEEHLTFYFLSASLYLGALRRMLGGLHVDGDGDVGASPTPYGMRGVGGAVVLLLLSRVMQSWNQTGVKHHGADDFAKFLQHHTAVLYCLCAGSLILVGLFAHMFAERACDRVKPQGLRPLMVWGVTVAVALVLISWHVECWHREHHAWSQLVSARAVYAVAVACMLLSCWAMARRREGEETYVGGRQGDVAGGEWLMVVGGVLFLTPLHHPWNWPLLVSLCLQGYSCANIAAASLHAGPAQETSSTGKRFNGGGTADTQHGSAAAHDVRVPFKLVVMMEWIGRCGYFALGNSNSIATINVSRAACLSAVHETLGNGVLAP